MDVLSISSPLSASVLSVNSTTISKPFLQSLKPQIFFPPPSPSLSLKTSLNPPRRTTACAAHTTGLGFGLELPRFDNSLQVAASQTQNDTMRIAAADPMGLLLRERIVLLGYEIDDFVADAVISQLLLLDAQDPTKDIRLFINSPGGSMSATIAIYDVMQLVRADVSTVALGIAASTASMVLGGGAKGKRLAMPNTRIMIHQPYGGAGGQVSDVEVQAREVMNTKQNALRIISSFTGRTMDKVDKFIDVDRYMSPVEAMDFGIIDGVVDEDSIVPLEPVPEVEATLSYAKAIEPDQKKFLYPEVPDDEIYSDETFMPIYNSHS